MPPKNSGGSTKFPGGHKVIHRTAQTAFVRVVTPRYVGKKPLPYNKRNCYPPYPDHYLNNRTAERRGRQIACAWRMWQGYNLRVLSCSSLAPTFSGLLQKDLFKEKLSLAKSYFKQNYCHAFHTRFAIFSCCVAVSSVMFQEHFLRLSCGKFPVATEHLTR